jgi:enediyne polyketide synthase
VAPASPSLAIVGMACRYPGARSPAELWENVLAQRQAFRQIPAERLAADDYVSSDPNAPDQTYSATVAVIEGYEFDRVRYRVSGETFRSADLAHWLALDVAAEALADAGFAEGSGLPSETTGVFLGNTLTGEFSRAGTMRLRWPYVRRVLAAALGETDWPQEDCKHFIGELESRYKSPFPPIGDESLAGALSNTIAGRICNYFDLKGGGYTVDGACASSLLSIANACSALVAGDLDVALAGGVDLSLDPLELVGFAKAGALARGEMRVYDERSGGFWPGEGCGVIVLMRHDDAVAAGRRIYASIRGWGISSDGAGGLTRPQPEGQKLALRRAYRRAGVGIESVAYFEGHGTGTSVGDTVELTSLSDSCRERQPGDTRAAIGSIKTLIGHTKAAAGAAGVIKAAMAIHRGIIPPTAGCEKPHPLLASESAPLRVLREGELWPRELPLRAGVSGMGFGGINAHVVLEGEGTAARREAFDAEETTALATRQDCEALFLSAGTRDLLLLQVDGLLAFCAGLSRAELTDLAHELARRLEYGPIRATVIASTPEECAGRLAWLKANMKSGPGVFFGETPGKPRVGILFPGQGSPAYLDGGLWGRRFPFVRDLYRNAAWDAFADRNSTAIAQPAIVTAELAALRMLDRLGISADLAVGHSLGELTALHWAGAMDEETLARIATRRGLAMASLNGATGAMSAIVADPHVVRELINGCQAVIAGMNSPLQTVISGERSAVFEVVGRARTAGFEAHDLPVSHAFHSPLVAAAAAPLSEFVTRERISSVKRSVFSTVKGRALSGGDDLRALIREQVAAPVRFAEAIAAAGRVDFWIEAGPGSVLAGLIRQIGPTPGAPPVASLDACGESMLGLAGAAALAFVSGVDIRHWALFENRFSRPFALDWKGRFFANPCESAPDGSPAEPKRSPHKDTGSALESVRGLVASRTELPISLVLDDSRLLSDLHLNSIVVGGIVAEAYREMGLSAPPAITEYADASIAEIAEAIEDSIRRGGRTARMERFAEGVASWIRPFEIVWVPVEIRSGRTVETELTIVIPPAPDESLIPLLLQSARQHASRYVMVQHGGGAASFARTFYLEANGVTTCVVDVPADHPKASDWIAAEVSAAPEGKYTEARYDRSGTRHERRLKLAQIGEDAPIDLTSADLLLVTGGGKGIGAECALALARETGVRLALMGRSLPGEDLELSKNLHRMRAAGIDVAYFTADVTDAAAVQQAVREIETAGGPITALLHSAGINAAHPLSALDESTFRATVAVKVGGCRNVLASLDAQRLRLLVTFGSVISHTGMAGEAHYAVANEWLTRLTEDWGARHPHCRSIAMDWSVWSGVGMGEKMGRVNALIEEGITPIPPDEGLALFRKLLGRSGSWVVAGRLGSSPTLRTEDAQLPFRRFLDVVRTHTPGVELIVDAEITESSDPFVRDHIFQRQALFPAVMGLEAMAQAAMALVGSRQAPEFENLEFSRPVTAPCTIRIAALAVAKDRVQVVLRSSETGYQIEHVRAVCSFAGAETQVMEPLPDGSRIVPDAGLDVARNLYGGLLFQTGPFRRLDGYRKLSALECVAEIAGGAGAAWFNRYLPQALELGDPGVRDAVLHSIQASIPHRIVLPAGVDRLSIFRPGDGPCISRAVERSHCGSEFIYDVDVFDVDGSPREQWRGLRLRAIGDAARPRAWPRALLPVYLERLLMELLPEAKLAIALEAAPRGSSLLHEGVTHRPDGKPETVNGVGVSFSYANGLILRVSGCGHIGCDMEPVAERTATQWCDLLGAERHALARRIGDETGEDINRAATRLWTVAETIRKAGAPLDSRLTLRSDAAPDGWRVFSAGAAIVASCLARSEESGAEFAVSIGAYA